MKTSGASMPSGGVAGERPRETSETGKEMGPRTSRRVAPSLQACGREYVSVWTSTPAVRNAVMPHSTAFVISGEPVTRPPMSSVRWRRLFSNGDSPITMGVILAAACAQEDGSVTEQAPGPWMICAGWSGSVFTGGICAKRDGAKQQRLKKARTEPRTGIKLVSFKEGIAVR